MTELIRKLWAENKIEKWLLLGLSCVLAGILFLMTSEVVESIQGRPETLWKIDKSLTNYLVTIRTPQLSAIALDITALGSGTVLTILVLIISLYFLFLKNINSAAHLIIVATGSGLITNLLKQIFERARPDILGRLVEVQGFSYPSGHSLSSAAIYFTIAYLTKDLLRSRRQAAINFSLFSILILLIASSRIYLGVHYFSDVSAGIVAGIAWGSLIAAANIFFASSKGVHAAS